ncbi:MAG: hypothetical protein K2X86_10665 [Cytophagaceae bacterium]|nr:hypothetical protein [Cytophagaceae bacterium]
MSKKKIVYILLLNFFFFISPLIFAQDEYKEKYERGKDYLNQGRYTVAMELLKPLTNELEGNKYVQYAHYFYALAAFKGGLYQDANTMLLQLTNKYPQWEKTEDAYYLLANVAFEQKKYRPALGYLKDRAKDLKDDIEKMKLFYFDQLPVIDTLINLQKDFPSDIALAKALAKKLSSFTTNEKYKMLLEYLVQEYKLDKKEYLKAGKESVKKASYNVALVLPFMMMKDVNIVSTKPNQYVFDLYEGIRMAVDSLKSKGVLINLYVYDSERDESKLPELMKLPELKSMDMIVGPLYPANFSLMNDFAVKNQILAINPFSSNSAIAEGNPYVLLFQPSLNAYAGQSAGYAATKFSQEKKIGRETKQAKSVFIFQSPTAKDSLLSNIYKDSITAKGFEVKQHMVVNKDNMRKVQEILGDSTKLISVNHIFISSTDQILAANIISAMEVSKTMIPLVVGGEWLQFSLLTYDQFERRVVHFIFPEYIDYNSNNIYKFRKAFLSRTNALPGNSAYQGYEMMSYFGKALGNYGNYFVSGIQKEGFTSGYLFQGYNFNSGNSNSFVPIVKFNDSNLRIMNNLLSPPVEE